MWIVYAPLALVVLAAIAAGVAVLVHRLRGTDDNPFIEEDRRQRE